MRCRLLRPSVPCCPRCCGARPHHLSALMSASTCAFSAGSFLQISSMVISSICACSGERAGSAPRHSRRARAAAGRASWPDFLGQARNRPAAMGQRRGATARRAWQGRVRGLHGRRGRAGGREAWGGRPGAMNRALTSSLSMDVSIACSSTMRFWLLSAAAPAAASCSAGRAFTNLLGRENRKQCPGCPRQARAEGWSLRGHGRRGGGLSKRANILKKKRPAP